MYRMNSFRSALILGAFLLALTAAFAGAQIKPIGTQGAYPDIQLDKAGNLHLVYGRLGKTYYRRLSASTGVLAAEEVTGCAASSDHQKQPDVAIDSKGVVHVLGGAVYNTRSASGWGKAFAPGINRDHHMTVDSNDNVWVVYRGLQLTAKMKAAKASAFGTAMNIFTGGGTDHVYPDITAGNDGSVHVVFRMRFPSNYDCAYVRYDPKTRKWAPVEWACNNGYAKVEEGPHIAIDRSGIPWVAIPEGGLRLNHRTGGKWNTVSTVGAAHTRDEPTIGVDSYGNKFIGKWGGTIYVYNAASSKWTTAKLPSTNGDPIGFVDVVGDASGAWMVYEQSKTVNKSIGARSAELVVVRVMPDGSIVPPSGPQAKPPLTATLSSLSAKTGGTVEFSLQAGEKRKYGGYLLMGSLSGTSPGVLLNNNALVPLNLDSFTLSVYQWSGQRAFERFTWWFDQWGNSIAFLRANPGQLTPIVGYKMYFAFVTLPQLDYASNAVSVQVLP